MFPVLGDVPVAPRSRLVDAKCEGAFADNPRRGPQARHEPDRERDGAIEQTHMEATR